MYRGLVPALLLTSHGMIQFAAYEKLKVVVPAPAGTPQQQQQGGAPSPAASWTSTLSSLWSASGYYFLLGAGSKMVATTVTYPSQVIKARIQQRGNAILKAASGPAPAIPYNGFLDTVAKIYAHEGPRGYYKGFAANLMRVTPQSAVTLVVYENVKHLMNTFVAPPPPSAPLPGR